MMTGAEHLWSAADDLGLLVARGLAEGAVDRQNPLLGIGHHDRLTGVLEHGRGLTFALACLGLFSAVVPVHKIGGAAIEVNRNQGYFDRKR